MCLMKIEYCQMDIVPSDAIPRQPIENVTSIDTAATGLRIETLLDGTFDLPGFKIQKIDCTQATIKITFNGDVGHA